MLQPSSLPTHSNLAFGVLYCAIQRLRRHSFLPPFPAYTYPIYPHHPLHCEAPRSFGLPAIHATDVSHTLRFRRSAQALEISRNSCISLVAFRASISYTPVYICCGCPCSNLYDTSHGMLRWTTTYSGSTSAREHPLPCWQAADGPAVAQPRCGRMPGPVI